MPWDSFTSTLPVSEECLRKGYLHFREYVDEETLKRIVVISLRVGTIEDYEIAGIAYSLSYFIQYILTIEEEGNGDKDLVDYFYNHMSNYRLYYLSHRYYLFSVKLDPIVLLIYRHVIRIWY